MREPGDFSAFLSGAPDEEGEDVTDAAFLSGAPDEGKGWFSFILLLSHFSSVKGVEFITQEEEDVVIDNDLIGDR